MNKITKIKNVFICIITVVFLLLLNVNSYAIGKFSIGIAAGGTYDPNNLENEIYQFNREIEFQKEYTAGTDGKQIDTPYAYTFGTSIKYQFNYILFRFGGHFSKPFTNSKGSFTSAAGERNTIRLSTYQASFPLSIAFMLPVKDMTYFYIGGGATLHNAAVKITQSNPDAGPFPGSSRKDSYSSTFPGWHLLIGAEVPVTKMYSISVEWMHQEGRSHPVRNDGIDNTGNRINSPKRTINIHGDFILFGVNYYISI
jgi:hypothetical protein